MNAPQPNTRATGQAWELQAQRWLESRGLQLVTANFRTRQGEIDLVMQDRGDIVFVEVRYRKSAHWGSAAESVDQRKRARLVHAAQYFLQQNPQHAERPCRFDVIAIEAQEKEPKIEWIRNAFDLT